MKKHLLTALVLLLAVFCFSSCQKTETFKVLQFNIWQEGAVVKGGFDAVADEIVRSDADFVTLSEVRNYHNTRFCDRIVEALKERGQTYYSFYTEDSGLLSRYPISDSSTVYPLNDDRGSIYRLVTKKGDQEFAVYTAHLDYRNCAYYDVRGYDGNDWGKIEPVTSLDSVLLLNRASVRDDAMARFVSVAEKDKAAGRIVILGGDFNEPSHLDWTEATKDMRDHYGLAIPWDVSVMLEKPDTKILIAKNILIRLLTRDLPVRETALISHWKTGLVARGRRPRPHRLYHVCSFRRTEPDRRNDRRT